MSQSNQHHKFGHNPLQLNRLSNKPQTHQDSLSLRKHILQQMAFLSPGKSTRSNVLLCSKANIFSSIAFRHPSCINALDRELGLDIDSRLAIKHFEDEDKQK